MAFVDLKFIYNAEKGQSDIVFDAQGRIEIDESFDSNINVAMGTDARANNKDIKLKELQRGNLMNLFNNYNNGSLLWLISQTRADRQTKNLAITHMRNCLKWLVTDGYLSDIKVTGKLGTEGITLFIEFKRISGGFDNFQYTAWNQSMYRLGAEPVVQVTPIGSKIFTENAAALLITEDGQNIIFE
jgi:phage gp46-like protein